LVYNGNYLDSLGFATENPAFWIMGLIFMTLGLLNKDKWKEPKKLSDLKDEERRARIIIMILLGLLVVGRFVILLFLNRRLI
jgi:uncharacterized membrane protein YidH (DUF202 family)